MTQVEKLRNLLGITDDGKDFILEFTISRVEDTIKNYCNLKEVPTELGGTVLSMAMELYRMENFADEDGKQVIQSISVGDTSTTFSTKDDREKRLLNDYKSQIDPFRRVRW